MAEIVPVSHKDVINNYGNPLVESLKKRMSLGTDRLRIGQQRDTAQKELDKLNESLAKAQDEKFKKDGAVRKAELEEQLRGYNSAETDTETKANPRDEQFYTYVKKKQAYYENNHGAPSAKDAQTQGSKAEVTRMNARAEMMEMIINKYVESAQAASGQFDKKVLGHSPAESGALIFDVTDEEGQLNIRKIAQKGMYGADMGTAAKKGAAGFGAAGSKDADKADLGAHLSKRGYIPMYQDGDLIKPGDRPNLDDPVAMAIAGKDKKASQKLLAVFALKSAGAEFFFGSTNKETARSKLFADADDRARGDANASVEFDITVSKTEQAVRGVSAEAAGAAKLEALEEKLQKMAFREQCFLVDHYKPIIQYKFGGGVAATKSWGTLNDYTYFSAVDINPALFTARVSGQPSLKPLFEITPAEFSQLLPKIKLYKRVPGKDALKAYAGPAGKRAPNPKVLAELKKISNKNKDPNAMIEVEIPFHINPTTQTINEIFANDKPRADGVGLKSFTFDFIGRNSFEVERNIVCKMELFFRNLEDLNSGSTLASFIDLILFGVSKENPDVNVNKFNQRVDYYHPDDYSMKAVVGWEVPPNSMLKHGLIKNKKLVELLKKNVLALVLNLTNHKINFSQDGSGTVEIDFIGAIEMKSFSNNLLATQKDENLKISLETLRANLRLEEKKLSHRKGQHNLKPNDPPGGMDTLGKKRRHQENQETKKRNFQSSADAVNNLREKINARETAFSKATYSSFFEQLYNRPILYVEIPENGDSAAGVVDSSSILGLVNNRMVADDEIAAAMRMSIPLLDNLQSKISVVPMGDPGFQKNRDALFESDKSSGKNASGLAMQTQRDNKVQKEKGPNDDDPKDHRKPKEASQESIDRKIYIGDPTPTGNRRIYFTYIGTVLEAGFQLVAKNILSEVSSLGIASSETVAAEMSARMMANRYLFGTMPFYDVREEKPVIVNIADLPIDLEFVRTVWFIPFGLIRLFENL